MRKSTGIIGAATSIALITTLAACSAQEGTPDGEPDGALRGQTIELIVPFSPGGGYDTYARLIAPELAAELGATVTVVNRPGAGGLVATNELWNARSDGRSIAILNMVGHLGSALAEAGGVQYQADEFSYIGRVASEPGVITTYADSPLSSFDDVLATGGVRFGAGGFGSLEYIDAAVLIEVVGVDGEIVTGFDGSGEAALALLSGNIDLHALELYSQLPSIQSGETRPLLVMSAEPTDPIQDVPVVMDYANASNRDLLESHVQLVESGRALAAPPGVDDAVLAELREAFERVATDPEFTQTAQDAGRPISFLSGEETQELVSLLMQSPPQYVEVLKRAFAQ